MERENQLQQTWRRPRHSTISLPQSSLAVKLSRFLVPDLLGGDWGSNVLPTVSKEQTQWNWMCVRYGVQPRSTEETGRCSCHAITFEKSWLSEVSSDWKKQTIFPLLRRTERKTWGTKAGEPLLCAWEDPGADSPGSTVKAHVRQRCDLRQPA